MDQYVSLFKALADETRLRIMVLLSKKEICVCQIQDALNLSQAKVSRHLMVLKHAGLVRSRRDGLWMYYSITQSKNCLETNIFTCFKDCLRNEKRFKNELEKIKKCDSARKPKGRRNGRKK